MAALFTQQGARASRVRSTIRGHWTLVFPRPAGKGEDVGRAESPRSFCLARSLPRSRIGDGNEIVFSEFAHTGDLWMMLARFLVADARRLASCPCTKTQSNSVGGHGGFQCAFGSADTSTGKDAFSSRSHRGDHRSEYGMFLFAVNAHKQVGKFEQRNGDDLSHLFAQAGDNLAKGHAGRSALDSGVPGQRAPPVGWVTAASDAIAYNGIKTVLHMTFPDRYYGVMAGGSRRGGDAWRCASRGRGNL